MMISEGDLVAFSSYANSANLNLVGEVVTIKFNSSLFIEVEDGWYVRGEREVRKLTNEESLLYRLEN
jgi:hypothetical protein